MFLRSHSSPPSLSVMSTVAQATATFYSHLASFPTVHVVKQPSCELGSIPGQHNMQSSMPVRSAPEPARTPTASASSPPPIKSPAPVKASPYALKKGGGGGGNAVNNGPPPAVGPKAAPPPPSKARKVRLLYAFTPEAQDAEGLPCNQGDVLIVKEQRGPDWLLCSNPATGREGYVPINYTEPA